MLLFWLIILVFEHACYSKCLTGTTNRLQLYFFDTKKAFDSVPYHQLISALEKKCIRGPLLNWIYDYPH